MIPQCFPKGSVDASRQELEEAFRRVLESGYYILGPEVEAFEAAFAAYLDVPDAIGVANGTQAVELALQAAGISAGHRVATVSHTAVATIAAIRRIGAIPVFVDIDPATLVMDLADLERVAPNVDAVVAVHLYGNVIPIEPLLDICHAHALKLVEDCAQAHGATWKGRKVGSFGDAAAFSFYPTKNLGAIGDGGAVAVSDAATASRVRLLREYGWQDRLSIIEGTNSRLDPLQAAFLSVFLPRLDLNNDCRRAIAEVYDKALDGTAVQTPAPTRHARHVYHQYVIQTDRRDDLMAFMADNGVRCAIHYAQPAHLQKAYTAFADRPLPVTEAACGRILSLPMFPQLDLADAAKAAALVHSFTSQGAR